MKARMLVGVGMVVALAMGATGARAAAHRVSGLVTAATDTSLQMTTTGKETATVGIDGRTDYMKWITHKPLQQDSRANRKSVAAGSCVDVELRADESGVAKIVRINTDGAGTFYDPCRAIR